MGYMTENKRYTTDNGSNEDVCLVDNVTGKEFESDFDEIVDLLNALHEDNQRLIRKNKRLHRDWDKLYDLCLDKGCTEDEIIKEMER